MTSRETRVGRYLDDLLRNARPRRFRASPEESEAMRGAIHLLPARAGADQGPDPAFVDRLGRRLRAELEGEPQTTPGVSRRRLIGAAGTLAAAAAAGAVTDNLLVTHETGPPAELVPASAHWIPVARAGTLTDGEPVRFNTGSVEGFVVRTGDSYHAISAVCTHQGCILQAAGQDRLSCPCHRTTFSLDGQVVVHQLPQTPSPLPRFRTRVNDGMVEVFAV